MKMWMLGVMCLVTTASAAGAMTPTPPTDAARELQLLARNLDRSARVLYVTAHPDDEDAGLLAKLIHGEGAEVALMTLTRGEGGQNEIGTELFHALGVLRSRELEAAGVYTGVTQYFSRAFEFGYSFSVEETFVKWGREAILQDVVRVMREFLPDVVLCMLPEGPGGGQHHQASARLAMEAFDVAGSSRWPELGTPHTPTRLFRQVWNEKETVTNRCVYNLGEYDPILGTTYAAVGAASRAQHKCQGMARLTDPIPRRDSRWEFLLGRSGDEPRPVPTFFTDTPSSLNSLLPDAPSRSALVSNPTDAIAWLALWRAVDDLRSRVRLDPTGLKRVDVLSARLARGLELAMGLRVRAELPRRDLVAGDEVDVTVEVSRATGPDATLSLSLHTDPASVADVAWDTESIALSPGVVRSVLGTLRVSASAPSTLPRPIPAHGDSIDTEHARAYLTPRWRTFSLRPTLSVGGTSIPLRAVPIVHQEVDPTFPRVFYSDPMVVPDPSIRPDVGAIAIPISGGVGSTTASFQVSSVKGGDVTVSFEPPPGWRVSPAITQLHTLARGGEREIRVVVEPDSVNAPAGVLRASAGYAGDLTVSRAGFRRVEYSHVRPSGLWTAAELDLHPVSCDVASGVRVGFIDGAGDKMPDALDVLGIPHTRLDADDLAAGEFAAYDVIISGARAYKVREDLKNAHAALMRWVHGGGVWIVQYNKLEFNDGQTVSSPYAPHSGTLVGRRRVTVEESPVVVNMPSHPIFTRPNLITDADWEGWVQERGLYFLDFEDARYEDLLTLEDPWSKNAGPKGGALVSTTVGDGRWVYVGIGLFRQLPAAVPGAYRVLANLIALGAE